VTAYLPWLLFPACLLLMMFMMRGMGSGASRRGTGSKRADRGTLSHVSPDQVAALGQQARIEQLEAEVAELRADPRRASRGKSAWRR
jgi:HAMP domain-containing protein